MEISLTGRRNIYLGIGNWIPVFYLEQQDTNPLAELHLCAARGNWFGDGDVSFRGGYDRSQCRRVRAGSFTKTATSGIAL